MWSELGGMAVRVAYYDGPSGFLHRRSDHCSVEVRAGRVNTASRQAAMAALGSGQQGTVESQSDVEGEGRP